jgi:lipoic acid synthetase
MTSSAAVVPQAPGESSLQRLPGWLKRPRPGGTGFNATAARLDSARLKTVCTESRCPNRHECWESGTATFLILGDVCTRGCGFCAVAGGRPGDPDPDEPYRLAVTAEDMRLAHVVITSVTRDDLPDQGAGQFVESIHAVKSRLPGSTVEVLTPDFRGEEDHILAVVAAGPDVFAHNLETVERLTPVIRPGAAYRRSLAVLATARRAASGTQTKSGLMLGLGEYEHEIGEALRDLVSAGVDMVTLGQYLRPTPQNVPVARYVTPEEFDRWGDRGRKMGFRQVTASPFARTSYHARGSLMESKANMASFAGPACRKPALPDQTPPGRS